MRAFFSTMASCVTQIVLLHCLVHVLNQCFVCIIFYFLSKGGKSLKDEDKLASFDIKDGGRLYFKDLGKIDNHTSGRTPE